MNGSLVFFIKLERIYDPRKCSFLVYYWKFSGFDVFISSFCTSYSSFGPFTYVSIRFPCLVYSRISAASSLWTVGLESFSFLSFGFIHQVPMLLLLSFLIVALNFASSVFSNKIRPLLMSVPCLENQSNLILKGRLETGHCS